MVPQSAAPGNIVEMLVQVILWKKIEYEKFGKYSFY